MDEIILQQKEAAKPLNGKTFILGIAGVVLQLAIAQIVVNLLIGLTGQGLLNIVFYLYAVWLLLGFMRRTVAAYVYTLRPGVLYLEKKLGDSTMSLVEIPLSRVVSMRPIYMAERLYTAYRQVTVIDPAARPVLRVRAAFVASLLSAHLARFLAGPKAHEQTGYVIVFVDQGQRHACVFRPDEALQTELEKQLGEAYGFDERMTQARVATLYARALERAFPEFYRYVDPLVRAEDMEKAREAIAAQKAAHAAGKKSAEKRKKAEKRETGSAKEKQEDSDGMKNDKKRRRKS